MNRQQIAIQNADVLHAHALYPQQEVSPRVKQGRIHLVVALDMFLRQDGFAGGHLADQRQTALFQLLFLFEQQADAADVPGMISMTPFGQGLQMFLPH